MNRPASAVNNRIWKINADQLRLIALFAMLLDHLWATIISGNQWMTCVGRIAFPIFAFQLAEGAVHSKDLKAYSKRLLIFALISEIPFNLIMSGSIIYPFHQNTLFTLLLGLTGIRSIMDIKACSTKKAAITGGLSIILYGIISAVGFVDYGLRGYATILMFYLFRGFRFARLAQFIALLLLNQVFFSGFGVPVSAFGYGFMLYYQCFAVLALIPIWLYNGQQGKHSSFVKKLSYVFYPVHLLAIYLIWMLFM